MTQLYKSNNLCKNVIPTLNKYFDICRKIDMILVQTNFTFIILL